MSAHSTAKCDKSQAHKKRNFVHMPEERMMKNTASTVCLQMIRYPLFK